MGRQINFFVLPGDFRIMEEAIQSTGNVMFLSGTAAEPLVQPLPTIEISEREMGNVPLGVYATRSDFVEGIRFRHVPQQGHFIIEPGSSVIELDRCYFDGKLLRRGRLYFYTGPGFNPEFIRWAEKVLRALRRFLVRKPDQIGLYYFGPAALAWMKKTGAQVTTSGLEVVVGAA